MKFILVPRAKRPLGWWVIRDDRFDDLPEILRPALLWNAPTRSTQGALIYQPRAGIQEQWVEINGNLTAGDLFVLQEKVFQCFGQGITAHPTKTLLIVKEEP